MQTELTSKRRNFDEAFKRDAVALLCKGEKPIKQLAQELGVSHWNLRDWKKRYGPPAPVRSSEVHLPPLSPFLLFPLFSSASPWSIKHLHRLIVNSATYRQSSRITPELYELDPNNRLLARASRLRVEGEIVRDIALATSGLLDPVVGGRSIFPPAPEFLFAPPASYAEKDWPVDTGPERYRRSLYIFRYRSVPYPLLQTFDAPNGDFSCVRRLRQHATTGPRVAQRNHVHGVRAGTGPQDLGGRRKL